MKNTVTERIEFQNAAQLIAAIEKLAGGMIRLGAIYIKDATGNELSQVSLEQETLSDGSVAFNLILKENTIAKMV